MMTLATMAAEVTALAASYVAMEMLCLYAARHKVPA